MGKTRSRALQWSKEVERRARDLYRRLYPDAQRAKFFGREDREGHPDIVAIPFHVQVKARDQLWVCNEWRKADAANETGGVTHLVVQSAGGPMLVCMRLLDYVEEIERVSNTGRSCVDCPVDDCRAAGDADADEGDHAVSGPEGCLCGHPSGCGQEIGVRHAEVHERVLGRALAATGTGGGA